MKNSQFACWVSRGLPPVIPKSLVAKMESKECDDKSSKKTILKITMSMAIINPQSHTTSAPISNHQKGHYHRPSYIQYNRLQSVVLIKFLKILWTLPTNYPFFFATDILKPIGGVLLKLRPLGYFRSLAIW